MLNIRGEPFVLPASFMTVDEKEFASQVSSFGNRVSNQV